MIHKFWKAVLTTDKREPETRFRVYEVEPRNSPSQIKSDEPLRIVLDNKWCFFCNVSNTSCVCTKYGEMIIRVMIGHRPR